MSLNKTPARHIQYNVQFQSLICTLLNFALNYFINFAVIVNDIINVNSCVYYICTNKSTNK
jgi:hypothetical protein